MSARQFLTVSYSQIAVFQASLPDPFNDWTDEHVNQGFAWRPGSVSFRTKANRGPHEVVITCGPYQNAPVAGLRVIEVPFTVSGSDPVVVASIGDEFVMDVPEGTYALRFAVLADDASYIELSFLRTDNPNFQILRADSDLVIAGPLLTQAEPA